ncbi:BTB/POZ domain-containing protein 6-A-like isoform X3 [Haliotis rubra]|uniref:BTB/POZ domain-containing protein 6-A-like isoform X3 n=1 Tax=Haliotis rubra TaxID=36100 RepID=UPI001EE554F5|nr:BTB/POZ domain-containing protein 6-A-like isoform X3 [Haliotis rubra]
MKHSMYGAWCRHNHVTRIPFNSWDNTETRVVQKFVTEQTDMAESGFVENWQNGRSVVECNRHMLNSKHTSDVTFRVGKDEDTVRAHRYVLISRSHVFDAMLCGPLAEKDDIKISDVEADVFSEMLMYLYTDCATVTPENVTGLLYLAKKYAVGGLEKLCLTFLEKSLTPENACLILEQAHMFDEKNLYNKAFKLVPRHGDICFASEGFKYLSHYCFNEAMRSRDLIILPKNAFEAATIWAEAECGRKGREITPNNLRSILGDIVYRIPFTSMDKEFYVDNVVPRGILTDAENVKIMSCLLCPGKVPSPFIRQSGKDFVLFDRHKVFSGVQTTQTRVYGRIDFTCSRDITVHSICLYGRGEGDKEFSTCQISRDDYRNIFGVIKFTLRSSEEVLETRHIKRYHLDTPVAIRAKEDYYIYVEMEKGSPVYVGDGEMESVTTGQCKLRRYFDIMHWEGHAELIYALEFTSQQS